MARAISPASVFADRPSSSSRVPVTCEPLESRRLLSAVIATTGETISTQAGQPFNGEIGIVTGLMRQKLRANINWGDGSQVTQGFFSKDASDNLHIGGSHIYNRGGTFTITVKLVRGTGRHRVVLAEFQSDTRVLETSVNLALNPRTPFSAVVGSFVTPPGGLDNAQVEIKWGDGQFSQGTLEPDAAGGEDIIGSHVYNRAGLYRITAVVTTGNEFSTTRVASVSSFVEVGQIIPTRP